MTSDILFLFVHKKILLKIADFAQIEKGDTVLEVGPGEGGLTEFLLEKSKKVIAVEKDAKLVEFLKQKFKKEIISNKLQIIEGDILEFSLMGTIRGNYTLVGNIPYYITGEIFRKFLESENGPKSITFVVQKEVAERILSPKGSILSISIRAFGTPEFGGVIKAGSFVPKPKVDSAIISVRNIHPSSLDLTLVKKGFSHKRKLLKSNLGIEGALLGILGRCGIAEKARAEELSLENWLCLAHHLNFGH
ncbi:MAG: 16S rRNA (adenine(1518)-N(6)/adenine(1519)-N(6))-dimethyltransferase RsmA, partial [Patescibacteria group bacterium]